MTGTTRQANAVADKRVRITAGNVWGYSCKMFNEDVVVLEAPLADILIANKTAKLTKDDVTIEINADGKRVVI